MTHHQATAKGLNRPVFFDRQSLNEQDLNCLVDYVRQGKRRHNRHVVGWGVTCGLPVTIAAKHPWMVQVGAGHAITPSGEEISVPGNAAPFDICEADRACLGIPGPCPAPFDLEAEHAPVATAAVDLPDFVSFSDQKPGTKLPNPVDLGWATISIADKTGNIAGVAKIDKMAPIVGLNMGFAALIKLTEPSDSVTLTLARGAATPMLRARNGAGDVIDEMAMTGPTLTPQTLTLTGDGIDTIRIIAKIPELFLMSMQLSVQTGGEVYLAICPDETPQCYKPGVPEYCMPPGDNMFPARICEGYKFDILCDLPPGHMPPSCKELNEMICGPMHIPCPPEDGPDCVIIATITANENGIVAIDEFAHRRRLIPQWVLAEREVCRCDVVPTVPPTEPTSFTLPTSFTQPTSFTLPSFFTGIVVSEIVVPPGGLEFDPIRGNALEITVLGDVGPVRRDRLRTAGITNLTEFIGRDSAELAEIMSVSEVKVAEMQEEARIKTMEAPR